MVMIGERRLLWTVFLQAITDASKEPSKTEGGQQRNISLSARQALHWIAVPNATWDLYTTLLDMDGDRLRKSIISAAWESTSAPAWSAEERRFFRLRYAWAQSADLFRGGFPEEIDDEND
jgi:hypothetical protein